MSEQEHVPLPPPPDSTKFIGQLAIDFICFALGIVGATLVVVTLGLGLLSWGLAIAVFAAAVVLGRFFRKLFGVTDLARTEQSAPHALEESESEEPR